LVDTQTKVWNRLSTRKKKKGSEILADLLNDIQNKKVFPADWKSRINYPI
jgi:hypothetical protein